MSEGLAWKTIELHTDILLPGILLYSEFLVMDIKMPVLMIQPAFVSSAIFVSISYALGLTAGLVSRFVLDNIVGEYGMRALFFEILVHGRRNRLYEYYKKLDFDENKNLFEKDLENELDQRFFQFIAEWNAIYRAALRHVPENKRAEVWRRRAQGRLTRGLFIPIVLGTGILAYKLEHAFCFVILITLLAAVLAACLYSYAELNNMSEAHDIT